MYRRRVASMRPGRALSAAFLCGAMLLAWAPTQDAAADSEPFLDGLDWQVMASGFYLFNAHRVAGSYNQLDYPYTSYMGFGLNFAGGDVSFTGEKFAITVDLRFGSAASELSVLAPLKQGFVSWMPLEKLTFDFGWFDTIYGSEFVDEWVNPNFTRGALYYLQQPFNHMGLRVSAKFNDHWALKFLVVNGNVGVGKVRGSPVGVDASPSLGVRLDISPIDEVTLHLGYLTGASGLNGNRAWGNFFDLILTARIQRFTLTFNGNATFDPPVDGGRYSYGVQLSGDMKVHDHWRVGARVEYLGGTVALPAGKDPDLVTVTATVRYIPVQYLVISLEPRFEHSLQDLFFTRNSPTDSTTGDPIGSSDIYFGLLLGVSAYIGN